MELLHQEMLRFYTNPRPRYSNPTYASTNIGSSLSLHPPALYRQLRNSSTQLDLTPSREVADRERRSTSQLSSIASNSLKSPIYCGSDRQVYEKQRSEFNIISLQPKQYPDSIKVYPKYRLEHEDAGYFRKLQLEQELENRLSQQRQQHARRHLESNIHA